MANYKRSGGNGIALKIYAAITSILLAAAIVLTSCAFALDWVKLPAQDEPAQEQPDEGGMEINESEEQGLSLMSASISPEDFADYGVSPLAESAYTVTATVTPALAVNKAVDWSVSWKNASSSWATGKTVTDYVTVTPTSDGALTASVACIKEFAEQIIVTATSRDNSDAKGTCTVDYRQKLLITAKNISEPKLPYLSIIQPILIMARFQQILPIPATPLALTAQAPDIIQTTSTALKTQ